MSDSTRRSFLRAGAGIAAVTIAGCLGNDTGSRGTDTGDLEEDQPAGDTASGETAGLASVSTATIHQGPACNCCDRYGEYLQDYLDVELDQRVTDDLIAVKVTHDIDQELWSCHTVELDVYVVEGHVPVEVIATLFEDEPIVDGIALPGMPAGTPGMGGRKNEPWTIYEIDSTGDRSVFTEF